MEMGSFIALNRRLQENWAARDLQKNSAEIDFTYKRDVLVLCRGGLKRKPQDNLFFQ